MKILALVNAHALAHVSRTLEIAKVLRLRGHEIIFAGHGKYLSIASNEDFEIIKLPFVPVQQVVKAIRSQQLGELFIESQLDEYIAAELELYRTFNPDLLLIDNRLTAATSGEIAGIKRVNIINVHISSFKSIPFYSIRYQLRWAPQAFVQLMDKIQTRIEAIFYDRIVMSDMNKVREKFGLQKKTGFAHEEGDLILFPDIPQFSPVSRLSENAHYIGPLTWHNHLPAPSCLKKLDLSKKTIYFTIGSEGFDELIDQLGVFSNHNLQVVVALGKKIDGMNISLPNNVFLEEFVNTDILFPHCDLVVCHGGNGTIYQALSFGLPIVGIATHEEQFYGLKRINELELGRGFSSKKLEKEGLVFLLDAILDVLDNKTYLRNAQSFEILLKGWQSADKGADLIEGFL